MENSKQPAFSTPNNKVTWPGLTKHEYTCIKLGIPETGDTVLDDLIRKSERKRIASMAMSGLLANDVMGRYLTPKEFAYKSLSITDQLLTQLEKK